LSTPPLSGTVRRWGGLSVSGSFQSDLLLSSPFCYSDFEKAKTRSQSFLMLITCQPFSAAR
jgi:hypothetical protein